MNLLILVEIWLCLMIYLDTKSTKVLKRAQAILILLMSPAELISEPWVYYIVID